MNGRTYTGNHLSCRRALTVVDKDSGEIKKPRHPGVESTMNDRREELVQLEADQLVLHDGHCAAKRALRFNNLVLRSQIETNLDDDISLNVPEGGPLIGRMIDMVCLQFASGPSFNESVKVLFLAINVFSQRERPKFKLIRIIATPSIWRSKHKYTQANFSDTETATERNVRDVRR